MVETDIKHRCFYAEEELLAMSSHLEECRERNQGCRNSYAGKFGEAENVWRIYGEFTLFKRLAGKVWRMNRSAKRLLLATTS